MITSGKNPKRHLIPQAHKLTVADQRAGGKKSGEVRREKRNFKQALEYALNQSANTKFIKRIEKKGLTLPDEPTLDDIGKAQAVLDYIKGKPQARRDVWEAQGIIKNKLNLDGEITVKTVRFE